MKKTILAGLFMSASFALGAQTIAVLSDIHVTPGNENEKKLQEAVAEINADKDIDMVVVCGDLTNEGSDEQLKNVKSFLDQIKHPSFVLPGNHENTWSQSATKTFFDLWGNDRFVTETDQYVIVGTNCGPYMKMGDGHVKQEDLKWLRSALQAKMKDGKKVISFNHYPLRANDLDNYQDYIDILEDFPTVIHINGHYHKYEPYKSGSINSMMVRALDNRKDYGYTICDFGKDSVIIYNKVLSRSPERIHAYSLATNEAVAEKESGMTVPQFDGFEFTKVYQDTASIFTRLGFSKDKVFFGNSLGYVSAVNKNGADKPEWTFKTDASLFARPIFTENRSLYVPSADRRMLVLDSENGGLIKEFPAAGPYVADGILSNGKVYVGGLKCFECYDVNENKMVWRYDSINNYCQASPTIYEDEIFFGAWDTNMRSLRTSDGKLNWKWNNGKNANMLGPGNVKPVVGKDVVIVVAPDRFMTAIDRKTGKTLWRDNSVKYRESLGVSEDGTKAYAKTMDGELICVEVNGDKYNKLWITDMKLGYEHAPCIVAEKDGVIYAGSRRGIISAVDADTHELLWNATLGSSEVNGIDVDPYSGDVFVSLIEGTVWKIAKK